MQQQPENSYDQTRIKILRVWQRYTLIFMFVCFIWIYSLSGDGVLFQLLSMFCLVYVLFYIYRTKIYLSSKKALDISIKESFLIPKLVERLQGEYDKNSSIPYTKFEDAGLYILESYEYEGEDLITTSSSFPLLLSDIALKLPIQGSIVNQPMIFGYFEYPFEFEGAIKVFSKHKRKYLRINTNGLDSVELESTHFAEYFTVFSTNQREARRVLRTDIIANLTDYMDSTGDCIDLSFENNHGYFSIIPQDSDDSILQFSPFEPIDTKSIQRKVDAVIVLVTSLEDTFKLYSMNLK